MPGKVLGFHAKKAQPLPFPKAIAGFRAPLPVMRDFSWFKLAQGK